MSKYHRIYINSLHNISILKLTATNKNHPLVQIIIVALMMPLFLEVRGRVGLLLCVVDDESWANCSSTTMRRSMLRMPYSFNDTATDAY
jgi:hypothetical protein